MLRVSISASSRRPLPLKKGGALIVRNAAGAGRTSDLVSKVSPSLSNRVTGPLSSRSCDVFFPRSLHVDAAVRFVSSFPSSSKSVRCQALPLRTSINNKNGSLFPVMNAARVGRSAIPHYHHYYQLTSRRSYIFLPASVSDITRFIHDTCLKLFQDEKRATTRLVLKLRAKKQEMNAKFVAKRLEAHAKFQRQREAFQLKRLVALRDEFKVRHDAFMKDVMRTKRLKAAAAAAAASASGHVEFRAFQFMKRASAAAAAAAPTADTPTATTTAAVATPTAPKFRFRPLKSRIDAAMRRHHRRRLAKHLLQQQDKHQYTFQTITITEPVQRHWFDEDGYPLTSRDPITQRFVNPWNSISTNGQHSLSELWKWRWERWRNNNNNNCNCNNEPPTEMEGANVVNYIQRILYGFFTGKTRSKKAIAPGSFLGDETSTMTTTTTSSSTSNTCSSSSSCTKPVNITPPSSCDKIKLTWIGHSTSLIQMSNFTLLTDPHFSDRASPIQMPFPMGVRRYTAPAMSVSDLPPVIDVVLLSHDHYDHLDYWSVVDLVSSKKVKYWIVPLGLKSWLMDECGIHGEDIVELEWWEGVQFVKRYDEEETEKKNDDGDDDNKEGGTCGQIDIVGLRRDFDKSRTRHTSERNARLAQTVNDGSENDCHEMVITCAPAQHWCSRTPFDRNRRLWCSWAVRTSASTSSSLSTLAEGDEKLERLPNEQEEIMMITTEETSQNDSNNIQGNNNNNNSKSLNFYFAGDTGLPPTFPLHRQIGDRLGPFDLAALPIGAYAPSFFMKDSHCNPVEAVKIHRDIRAKRSVAIHWGTFALADEQYDEPPKLLQEAVRKASLMEIGLLGNEKNDQMTQNVEEGGGLVEATAVTPVDFVVIPLGDSIESTGVEESFSPLRVSPFPEKDVLVESVAAMSESVDDVGEVEERNAALYG